MDCYLAAFISRTTVSWLGSLRKIGPVSKVTCILYGCDLFCFDGVTSDFPSVKENRIQLKQEKATKAETTKMGLSPPFLCIFQKTEEHKTLHT